MSEAGGESWCWQRDVQPCISVAKVWDMHSDILVFNALLLHVCAAALLPVWCAPSEPRACTVACVTNPRAFLCVRQTRACPRAPLFSVQAAELHWRVPMKTHACLFACPCDGVSKCFLCLFPLVCAREEKEIFILFLFFCIVYRKKKKKLARENGISFS